jgi:hypothetical protein
MPFNLLREFRKEKKKKKKKDVNMFKILKNFKLKHHPLSFYIYVISYLYFITSNLLLLSFDFIILYFFDILYVILDFIILYFFDILDGIKKITSMSF